MPCAHPASRAPSSTWQAQGEDEIDFFAAMDADGDGLISGEEGRKFLEDLLSQADGEKPKGKDEV